MQLKKKKNGTHRLQLNKTGFVAFRSVNIYMQTDMMTTYDFNKHSYQKADST